MPDIQQKIEDFAGEKIVNSHSIGGGSIASTQWMETESGRRFVLKTGAQDKKMFPCEANGLRELEKAEAIHIPHVYLAEEDFLLMDYVEAAPQKKDFWEQFGRRFAKMHRYRGGQYGFHEDNFIGHTEQKNIAGKHQQQDWKAFYFEKRLLYQYNLAESRGLASPKLTKGFREIESKIDDIIGDSAEYPALLHGDLWSGNFIVDEKGEPCLIDPAVYYGQREADLAMTKVFGGFSPRFYDAYEEAFPLPPGHRQRENIYKLYHILNHLNLFGAGYLGQAEGLLWSYL